MRILFILLLPFFVFAEYTPEIFKLGDYINIDVDVYRLSRTVRCLTESHFYTTTPLSVGSYYSRSGVTVYTSLSCDYPGYTDSTCKHVNTGNYNYVGDYCEYEVSYVPCSDLANDPSWHISGAPQDQCNVKSLNSLLSPDVNLVVSKAVYCGEVCYYQSYSCDDGAPPYVDPNDPSIRTCDRSCEDVGYVKQNGQCVSSSSSSSLSSSSSSSSSDSSSDSSSFSSDQGEDTVGDSGDTGGGDTGDGADGDTGGGDAGDDGNTGDNGDDNSGDDGGSDGDTGDTGDGADVETGDSGDGGDNTGDGDTDFDGESSEASSSTGGSDAGNGGGEDGEESSSSGDLNTCSTIILYLVENGEIISNTNFNASPADPYPEQSHCSEYFTQYSISTLPKSFRANGCEGYCILGDDISSSSSSSSSPPPSSSSSSSSSSSDENATSSFDDSNIVAAIDRLNSSQSSRFSSLASTITDLFSSLASTNSEGFSSLGSVNSAGFSSLASINSAGFSSVAGAIGDLGEKIDNVGSAVSGLGIKIDSLNTNIGTKLDKINKNLEGDPVDDKGLFSGIGDFANDVKNTFNDMDQKLNDLQSMLDGDALQISPSSGCDPIFTWSLWGHTYSLRLCPVVSPIAPILYWGINLIALIISIRILSVAIRVLVNF